MPRGAHATCTALLELISHDMSLRVRRQTSFARDLEKMNQAWGERNTSIPCPALLVKRVVPQDEGEREGERKRLWRVILVRHSP